MWLSITVYFYAARKFYIRASSHFIYRPSGRSVLLVSTCCTQWLCQKGFFLFTPHFPVHICVCVCVCVCVCIYLRARTLVIDMLYNISNVL
jgi:hypothetical protein